MTVIQEHTTSPKARYRQEREGKTEKGENISWSKDIQQILNTETQVFCI